MRVMKNPRTGQHYLEHKGMCYGPAQSPEVVAALLLGYFPPTWTWDGRRLPHLETQLLVVEDAPLPPEWAEKLRVNSPGGQYQVFHRQAAPVPSGFAADRGGWYYRGIRRGVRFRVSGQFATFDDAFAAASEEENEAIIMREGADGA